MGKGTLGPGDIIRRKRDGAAIRPEDLESFIRAYVDGQVADYHMAAFLMAVFFQGMTGEETAALTRVMRDSGRRVDLARFGGKTADKHSTGGVGDKVSLVLAPLVAAAGVVVPMMSGRGLGHTGGTIDKLESIPGYRALLPIERFHRQLDEIGVAIIAQSEDLAPADRRMYALRDVTATVESIPLISASIMSKKLAEGCDCLVLDVKVGSGAFMKTAADAEQLARTMVAIGAHSGVRTTARLTAMDQPLGRAIGNALEVREAIDCLRGGGPADLRELTLVLGAEMLAGVGAAADLDSGRARLEELLDRGAAFERFGQMVRAQEGDPRYLDEPDRFEVAPVQLTLEAPDGGILAALDTQEIGAVACRLGAGRTRLEDPVDPAVGLEWLVRRGHRIERGQPVARIHARSPEAAEAARRDLLATLDLRPDIEPFEAPLFYRRIDATEVVRT